jgi:hypothetical protein
MFRVCCANGESFLKDRTIIRRPANRAIERQRQDERGSTHKVEFPAAGIARAARESRTLVLFAFCFPQGEMHK